MEGASADQNPRRSSLVRMLAAALAGAIGAFGAPVAQAHGVASAAPSVVKAASGAAAAGESTPD